MGVGVGVGLESLCGLKLEIGERSSDEIGVGEMRARYAGTDHRLWLVVGGSF